MGLWHEEVDDWVLTYNRKDDGSKDILSATNTDTGEYLSPGEPEGLQKPLETLYRHPDYTEIEALEPGEIEEREVTAEGLKILEENVREEAAQSDEKLLADGKGYDDCDDAQTAEMRSAAFDHTWNPMEP